VTPAAPPGTGLPGAGPPGSSLPGSSLPGAGPPAAMMAITTREREVLALIAAGLSNTEIADRLAISPATAKTHVGHLLTKLAARDRVHLVILAYQAGLGPAC